MKDLLKQMLAEQNERRAAEALRHELEQWGISTELYSDQEIADLAAGFAANVTRIQRNGGGHVRRKNG